MRLDSHSVDTIKQRVGQLLGHDAQVRLFGSRLDDTQRGGDIDLHIRLEKALENATWQAALLSAGLQRRLDGRKVDVRIWWEGTPCLPLDRVALEQGQLL